MRNITLLTAPAMMAAILMVIPQGDASAHRVIVRDYPYYDSDAVYFSQRRTILPRWLRHRADFVRWYHLNHHYYDYAIGWNRLYRHYERDYRYHRYFNGKRWAKSRKRSDKSHKRWAKSHEKRYRNSKRRRHYRDD